MPLYKFSQNDLFHNRIETHPQYNFFFYDGSAYYNNRPALSGAFSGEVPNVPSGHVSLYEMNIDRISGSSDEDSDLPAEIPDIIYSFITKDSDYTDYRTPRYLYDDEDRRQLVTTQREYGDIITGSYPMSASITKEYFQPLHMSSSTRDIIRATDLGTEVLQDSEEYVAVAGEQTIRLSHHSLHPSHRMMEPEGPVIDGVVETYGLTPKSTLGSKINALKNTLNSYMHLSKHYAFASSSLPLTGAAVTDDDGALLEKRSWPAASNEVVNWDKAEQEIGLLSIPSIFYGRQIQKGTVSLKFYISGTLVGELQDKYKNGELVQVGPTASVNSGSTAGVVLYNEGFMLLTGSWDLSAEPIPASALLTFTATPSNNDTLSVTDSEGNDVVFKFTTANSTTDGSLHADGNSVNVGIGGTPANYGANRFRTAFNNVTDYSNGLTLNITVGRAGNNGTGRMIMQQDTTGINGNTNITIKSSAITGPSLSKFAGGVDGSYSFHTENYLGSGPAAEGSVYLSIGTPTPSALDEKTITIPDALGNVITFQFDVDHTTADGRINADGNVVVGINSLSTNVAIKNKLKDAINNVSSYANGLQLDIRAVDSGDGNNNIVLLYQNRKGRAGNTTITTTSDDVSLNNNGLFRNGAGDPPRWIDFAQTIATGSVSMPSSSFELLFKGTNYVPTMTMMAHARKGHLNFSNNSTYIEHGQQMTPASSSVKFEEKKELKIKNIVSSSYDNFTASYKRQTYISKIGIYDEKKNLIGIAKVATPIKKTEDRDFTFKLKLDF